MITTVTLHAAIDRTYYVDKFNVGQVQRVARQVDEPGGKGNNVAKVIRQLGGEVTATGIIAGSNGAFIESSLTDRGIQTAFVHGPGESRVCLNILDESSGTSTELLGQGPAITGSEVEAIKQRVRQLALQSTVVVLSGSLPAGAPEGLYAELTGIVRSTGARAFLDTSGRAFSAALDGTSHLDVMPHFVKPNEQELSGWLGHIPQELSEWTRAAQMLADQGIAEVCVTLGSRGAVAILDGAAYLVTPPVIQPVNTVGCGDAFVAGMAYAEERGDSAADRLRTAAAAAAANAMSAKAGDIDYRHFREYERQVQITAL
ncbi:1-phosphofructokinase family hexose kinase [Paenibacillus sp. P96]|uniref:Tagatose-6-phosphate kinase n=1 Tax=Paenibacillus zeirhizosphaerae TaxID=2987519 RepID=A0ABT9FU45_9BACL|nr:1-phosphofructokinase family hexose kinase [Paenibacillus sp. P96]MDP4098233.1 1-phosphofructokinase family hexose kinase [Paenibacillus sp. P96]